MIGKERKLNSIFTDEQKEKLKRNISQMIDALNTIEKGLDSTDVINQFRSGDITISLAKAFDSIIELQTDSILNIVKILKCKYKLDITVYEDLVTQLMH